LIDFDNNAVDRPVAEVKKIRQVEIFKGLFDLSSSTHLRVAVGKTGAVEFAGPNNSFDNNSSSQIPAV
jgi:hypothetical protein